jgi:hypothetical protein
MTNVAQLMTNAKEALTKGNREIASDNLNKGIVILARLTQEGTVRTEGATVDRWKERFWFALEENNLIED